MEPTVWHNYEEASKFAEGTAEELGPQWTFKVRKVYPFSDFFAEFDRNLLPGNGAYIRPEVLRDKGRWWCRVELQYTEVGFGRGVTPKEALENAIGEAVSGMRSEMEELENRIKVVNGILEGVKK
jgi:hypothetical protein